MAHSQIKRLRVRHKAIAEYLLAHPDANNKEVADRFGISQSYLSIVINSDLFRELMHKLEDKYFRERIIPLRDKVAGVSHRAVERLGEKVEHSEDPKFLLEVADKTLGRLGYGGSSGKERGEGQDPSVHLHYHAPREELDKAREFFGRAKDVTPPQDLEESNQLPDNRQEQEQEHEEKSDDSELLGG